MSAHAGGPGGMVKKSRPRESRRGCNPKNTYYCGVLQTPRPPKQRKVSRVKMAEKLVLFEVEVPMELTLEDDNEPSPRPEPASPDTPRLADLYYRACEVSRLLDAELKGCARVHGKGRRHDILVRSVMMARKLTKALAPAASL
jgi:hypothetical protein